MNNYTVYMHTCPNGKRYIGITRVGVNARWRNGSGYQHNPYFKNAIAKYGWDNIVHEILFKDFTKEQAEQKEIELIAFYEANNRHYGYNIANGGSCSESASKETREKLRINMLGNKYALGRKLSDAHKNKISLANLGRRHTEETKKICSETNKGNKYWLGKRHSEESKQKMKESSTGKIATAETRRKISEAGTGRKQSEYTIKKRLKAMEGFKHTEQSKQKMRENAHCKQVLQIDINTMEVLYKFDSLSDAERSINKKNSSIQQAVRGKCKTAYGYIWKYAE